MMDNPMIINLSTPKKSVFIAMALPKIEDILNLPTIASLKVLFISIRTSTTYNA